MGTALQVATGRCYRVTGVGPAGFHVRIVDNQGVPVRLRYGELGCRDQGAEQLRVAQQV